MTVEKMIEWLKDNFDEKDVMEARCHFGNIVFLGSVKRQPLGLADNVWFKNGEGPYNNCIVYRSPDMQCLRIIIEGRIYNIASIEMGEELDVEFNRDGGTKSGRN